MFRALIAALLLLFTPPVLAEPCQGRNLLASLPEADLAALSARAEVPFAHGNLWQASKGVMTMTLVGTYHLKDPRFAPVLDRLRPVLANASVLLVEAGPREEAALKAKVAAEPGLMLTQGPTLPEQLSPQDWQSLSGALKARGVVPVMAARMQPWLLASILEMPACLFPLAPDAAEGLDRQLIQAAQDQGLAIRPLERFDAVLAIFAQFKPRDQLEMLMQTVAADAQSDDMAATLADSYFAGESRLFLEFSRQQMLTLPGMTPQKADAELALVDRAMITSRNASWIAVLEAEAARGPVLAAFGALHLAGEGGVLNLLAQRGWHLSPLTP